MSIVRYETWPARQWPGDIFSLFDELAGAVARGSSDTWEPRVDIEEYADRYELRAELPGIDPAQVEITLGEGVLTLSGERPAPAESEAVQRRRIEMRAGRFSRQFRLPDTVDTDNIQARGENGVIHLHIPKRARPQPLKIQVAA